MQKSLSGVRSKELLRLIGQSAEVYGDLLYARERVLLGHGRQPIRTSFVERGARSVRGPSAWFP